MRLSSGFPSLRFLLRCERGQGPVKDWLPGGPPHLGWWLGLFVALQVERPKNTFDVLHAGARASSRRAPVRTRESGGRKEGPAAPGKLVPDVRNQGNDKHAFEPALLDRTMLPLGEADDATAPLNQHCWMSFLRAACR